MRPFYRRFGVVVMLFVVYVVSISLPFSGTQTIAAQTVCRPTTGTLDVVFLIDQTGSMERVINTARREANDIATNVRALVPDTAFGVASFADYPLAGDTYETGEDYGLASDEPFTLQQDLSSDITRLRAGLNNIALASGGDGPEAYSRAIAETASLGWRDGARRVAVLIGDASPHSVDTVYGDGIPDPGRDGAVGTADDIRLFTDAVATASGAQVTIVGLGIEGGSFGPKTVASFTYAAQTTGGRYQQIPTSSSIAKPIADLVSGVVCEETPTPAPEPLPTLPVTGVDGAPVFFPETGYALGGDFLDYWQTHGGLPVFGFPIDSERKVSNQVSQWLERNRFEIHPQNKAPYNVLLGRLGVELLVRQGRPWEGLAKASPGAAHYFAQTGHAIAPQFWSYWSSHGLEFDGRRGKIEAESLALFGYPISEAQVETNASGDRVVTQWFERARFEYHPTNPEASRVLLGRLGAEIRQ